MLLLSSNDGLSMFSISFLPFSFFLFFNYLVGSKLQAATYTRKHQQIGTHFFCEMSTLN